MVLGHLKPGLAAPERDGPPLAGEADPNLAVGVDPEARPVVAHRSECASHGPRMETRPARTGWRRGHRASTRPCASRAQTPNRPGPARRAGGAEPCSPSGHDLAAQAQPGRAGRRRDDVDPRPARRRAQGVQRRPARRRRHEPPRRRLRRQCRAWAEARSGGRAISCADLASRSASRTLRMIRRPRIEWFSTTDSVTHSRRAVSFCDKP